MSSAFDEVVSVSTPLGPKDIRLVTSTTGGLSRDISMVEAIAAPGTRTGAHSHAGDEHHIVLRGHFRMTQGDHVIEVGPGDYVRWDGTIPHDAETIDDEEGHVLIVTLLARS